METRELLQKWCRNIYLTGSGNFWYEDEFKEIDRNALYRIYSFASYSLFVIMTILELMAIVDGDLLNEEKNDCVAMLICHITIITKLLIVMSNKKKIRIFLRNLTKVCEMYEDVGLMEKRYRSVMITVVGYYVAVYVAVFCYILQGFWKMYLGQNFVVVVTYYPNHSDSSIPAHIFRISTTILLIMLMLTMIAGTEGFITVNLIIIRYKFITLNRYFESLCRDTDIAQRHDTELACEQLNQGLIKGIKMHNVLLRLTKEFEDTFGTTIGMQLGESVGSAIAILLQAMLLEEFTFIIAAKAAFFAIALYLMLGIFLCKAGDITYETLKTTYSVFALFYSQYK